MYYSIHQDKVSGQREVDAEVAEGVKAVGGVKAVDTLPRQMYCCLQLRRQPLTLLLQLRGMAETNYEVGAQCEVDAKGVVRAVDLRSLLRQQQPSIALQLLAGEVIVDKLLHIY